MRKVIIREPRHVAPFNEPAHALSILNKALWQWQRDLLAPHINGEIVIDRLDDVPQQAAEMIVYRDNLWFDKPFLETFLTEARERGRPVRAAFRASDPAFLQQGLRELTTSYEQRGDLYYVDLWYFPKGPSMQIEPVIISSDAREVGYYHIPPYMSDETGELVWWLPERSVCAIDSWVHVFFANIVFGVFSQASRFESKASERGFRMQARLRAILERKSLLASSTYVHVGRNCSIDPGTIIRGPVVIGDNVTIGPGCTVTQSIIGNNVTLTHGNDFHMSVIGDGCFFPWGASGYFSTFMEGSSAAQNASLEMSVIGRSSTIGGGTIFASFNLLPTPRQATSDHPMTRTGMPVLGGCVGHNCRIGAGLVIYPSRMIESDVVLIPSPTRRVIMKDISYEESDHHAAMSTETHPRLYPRREEATEEPVEAGW